MTNVTQAALACLENPLTEIRATPIPATTQTDVDSTHSGVRGLMLAVLEDAIHSRKSSECRVREEAERWMSSRQCRYIFSFAVICETLDLDPTGVRRSVMGLLAKKRRSGRLIRRSRPNVRRAGAIHLM
jgi:hypothetical protein